MIETWIGCSGFHYKEWKEVFYPAGLPQKKWFDHYCKRFNTLELNTTFYRFPRVQTLKNWHDISPALYRFSVKAPRLITHFKQFKDSKSMLADFYGTSLQGLGNKLGCILFQLPARVKYSEEVLDRIIENLDPAFLNVVEFRDESWWKKKVFTRLSRFKIAFCGISYPGLPDEVIQNIQLAYYRFHGIPVLYKSCYKKAEVIRVADQLLSITKTSDAYIYFNNTWGTGAITNATQLIAYCNLMKHKNSFHLQKTA